MNPNNNDPTSTQPGSVSPNTPTQIQQPQITPQQPQPTQPVQPVQPVVPPSQQAPAFGSQPKRHTALKVILIVVGVIIGLFILLAILGAFLDKSGNSSSTGTNKPNNSKASAFSNSELSDLKAFGDQVLQPIKTGDYGTAYANASDVFKKAVPRGSANYNQAFGALKLFLVSSDTGQPMKLVYIGKASTDSDSGKNEYSILYLIPGKSYTNPSGQTTSGDSYISVLVTADRKHFDSVLPMATADTAKAAADQMVAPLEAAFKVNYPSVAPRTTLEAQN